MPKLRLHLFSALLLGWVGTLGISYWHIERNETAALRGSLHNQLLSIRSRWEHAFAMIRQEALAMIDQRALPHLSALQAVRTFVQNDSGEWIYSNRVRHAPGDPRRLGPSDFSALDRAYPIPFQKVAENADFLRFARLPSDRPSLRYATRIGDTIYVIEIDHEPMTRKLEGISATTQFILGSDGELIAQSDPKHFVLGEDLSHMPLTEVALETRSPTPHEIAYKELPSRPTQLAKWCYSKLGNFVLVTQAPMSHGFIGFLKKRDTAYLLVAHSLLAALIFTWIALALRVFKKNRAI